MEQPNNTHDIARLNRRFWRALLATAVAAGLFGALMMAVLRAIQGMAYGFHGRGLDVPVEHVVPERRLVALVVGGAVVGLLWFLLRRYTSGATDVDDAVWSGSGDLALPRSLATGTLSEVAVGVGASLGREAAPKLLGAAAGSALSHWMGLDPAQRRLVVACGAGAGMGAVYNVPIGGALLTAELLMGQLALPVVLPALLCSVLATAVSWVYLPHTATYPGLPAFEIHPSLILFAAVSGPLVGLAAVALIRVIGWMSHHQLRGRAVLVGPLLAFTVLGLLASPFPLLLGNGKELTSQAFLGTASASLLMLLALVILKPTVTVLCLGSGASGGLFTPVMSTGAVLGLLLGHLWLHLWPGPTLAAFAVVTAAALTGAAMQAPLAALVLVLELTGTTEPLVVPMVLATVLATGVARRLDGYSVYSARLQAKPPDQEPIDAVHS